MDHKTLSGTCAESIIAGVHLGEVSVDGGSLGGVVGAVQAAVADGVEIAAVWRRDKTGGNKDLKLSSQHRLTSPGSSFFHQRKKKHLLT